MGAALVQADPLSQGRLTLLSGLNTCFTGDPTSDQFGV